jgi:hypothetical protein
MSSARIYAATALAPEAAPAAPGEPGLGLSLARKDISNCTKNLKTMEKLTSILLGS